MSNNPMKRPVHKRKLHTMKLPRLMTDGSTQTVQLLLGMANWRKMVGQK